MPCFERRDDEVFDPTHRFESSWLLSPWVLFSVRATISFYCFVVLFFNIIWTATKPEYGGLRGAGLSFSYFTILTYWGLAFYFLFAALHTFTYARTGNPLLNRWPRFLQTLHSIYFTTISTYPILVTIVFWAVLYTGPWFPKKFNAWSNISEHAMNSLFCLFEIILTRTAPQPWLHLVALIFILALYLSLAYLTHATKGVYVYGFLDPTKGKARCAGYIIGILLATIVIFAISWALIKLRTWIMETKMGKMGKLFNGKSVEEDQEQGGMEMQIHKY